MIRFLFAPPCHSTATQQSWRHFVPADFRGQRMKISLKALNRLTKAASSMQRSPLRDCRCKPPLAQRLGSNSLLNLPPQAQSPRGCCITHTRAPQNICQICQQVTYPPPPPLHLLCRPRARHRRREGAGPECCKALLEFQLPTLFSPLSRQC